MISSSSSEIHEGNEVGVCRKSMISTLGGAVKRSGASTSKNFFSMVKQSYFEKDFSALPGSCCPYKIKKKHSDSESIYIVASP